MQTITAAITHISDDGAIVLDNWWSVTPSYGAVMVRRPTPPDLVCDGQRLNDIAAIFSDLEAALVWAASGGRDDSATGVKVKPR